MKSISQALFDSKRLIVVGSLLASGWIFGATVFAEEFTDEERAYWAFQAISNPEIPKVRADDWVRNPIDAFILERIDAEKLVPTPEADRRTLIRRATLDLLGVPPTAEAIETFVKDPDPDAYERLVDRLLESPRYGERYARHWLDLVRYADSDGFKSDVLRPDAWRYRDYVIESLNQDKPYARFVKEQIAGDELYPDDDDAKKATGYLRLWPYEDNQPDMGRHWEATLDDIADVSGDVFLGLSMKCARCHDHKFDPISQTDYYRFRAFFAAISPWEEVYLGGADADRAYQTQMDTWYSMTAGIQEEMESIKEEPWKSRWEFGFAKLPPYVQEIVRKEERSPYEEQLARFADKLMVYLADRDAEKNIKGDDKERWNELKAELAKYDPYKPKERERVSAVRDVGGIAPKTMIESKNGEREVPPGYLSILGSGDASIQRIDGNPNTTGRRATLANWLVDGENRLSNRVIVNRVWQWHFGSGIVNSSNDFGILGDRPSHPELLDWLARRFVDQNGSLKSMHRLIMTSATYRQGSARKDEVAEEVDPDNRLLWRMPVRRMDAEQLRDSVLFVSGEIDTSMGGPGISEEESARRSIYVINKRNKLRTTMNAFDTPDLHNSCHMRDVTTTPLQALALINGDWTFSRAEAFADRMMNCGASGSEERIEAAYRDALGRNPTNEEIAGALEFLDSANESDEARESAWIDFCHVLLNTNEFIYIN